MNLFIMHPVSGRRAERRMKLIGRRSAGRNERPWDLHLQIFLSMMHSYGTQVSGCSECWEKGSHVTFYAHWYLVQLGALKLTPYDSHEYLTVLEFSRFNFHLSQHLNV